MVSIIARGSKDDGSVNLYARIFKRNVINNALALGLTLNQTDWNFIESILKSAAVAQKMGGTISIRDSLALKLWNIKNGLDVMLSSGNISVSKARDYVSKILCKDIIKDVETVSDEKEPVMDENTSNRKTLKEFIREFIRECETGERLKRKSTRKIAASTIKNYKGTLAQIEEYEKASHHSIDFDDMTMDFYDGWRQFFIGKKYSPNTIGRHVKNLKIFLYAAKDLKLTTTTDFESARFSADREDVDNVYLTDERVQEMYDFRPTDEESLARLIGLAPANEREELRELTEKATSRQLLEEAKDVFVVGCLTGQRVSDYKRIHSGMIERLRDGRRYICIEQEKTGKEVFLPLDERVEKILAKYGGRLPKTYDQKLNERIKIVGRLLGWRENAGLTERHGLMEVRSRKKFYECIKTHTARRTFATNAYKNGISLASIMAVTGHSSEQMLRKYLKLDSKERAILAAEEFSRLRVKEAE